MGVIEPVLFRIHHISHDGKVMFTPIKDENNQLLHGALFLDTEAWPSVTDEYRKAQELGRRYYFDGEHFKEVKA